MRNIESCTKRILVTGAAGFLGSHLCDALLGNGNYVTGIDNLLSGRVYNLTSAFGNERFEFLEHDVIEPFSGVYDRIYHLASPASPPLYQKDPINTAKVNFLGTLNALELARHTGARILLASTSEIYGDPEQHPQKESYAGCVNPIGPRSCYDEGKRIAETLAFDFKRMHGVDIRVARIFNTYGPRMLPDDGRVVSNFICQALQGDDITIFGNGRQTRSFCYYSDLLAAMQGLMEIDAVTGPVNIGNPEEVDIQTMAERILELTGSKSRIVTKALPEDDPKRRSPDISKAKELLGWVPQVSFNEGMMLTVRHFQELLKQGAHG